MRTSEISNQWDTLMRLPGSNSDSFCSKRMKAVATGMVLVKVAPPQFLIPVYHGWGYLVTLWKKRNFKPIVFNGLQGFPHLTKFSLWITCG